jgi:LysM repeat protein
VGQGDLLYELALRFNTTVEAIVALNPQINPDSLVIGDVLRIPVGSAVPDAPKAQPRSGEIAYTIRPGDTLYELAPRFNTTVEAIAKLNPQIAPERLVVGQELRIPIAQAQSAQERTP